MGRFKEMRNKILKAKKLSAVKNTFLGNKEIESHALISEEVYYDEDCEVFSHICEEVYKIINERTFDIDDAVDFFYEKSGVADFIKKYESDPASVVNDIRASQKELKLKLNQNPMSTLDYNEGVIKDANEKLFPVTVKFSPYQNGSHYSPDHKEVVLGIHFDAMEFLGKDGLETNPESHHSGDPKKVRMAKKENTEARMKDRLAHELTHWIEDALYNRKTQRGVYKYVRDKDSEYHDPQKTEVRFRQTSSHEVESLTQQVKTHKREIGTEKWGQMDLVDLIQEIPTLDLYISKVKTTLFRSEYRKFIRTLFKRFFREGLLSDKMIEDFKTFK